MRKNRLIIDYAYDFELMGISASAKGYKLAWELNQRLGLHLVKQQDLVVGFRSNEERAFGFYAHQTPLNRLKLFKNKPTDPDSGKYFLIPEFPHFDFIILAAMEDYTLEQLIELVRAIPSVQLATPIPLAGLKSKSNFIF